MRVVLWMIAVAAAVVRPMFAEPSGNDRQMLVDVRRAEYVAWIAEHFAAIEPSMHELDGRRWALNHTRLVLNRDLDKADRYFQSAKLTTDADIYFIRFLKTLLDFQDSPRLSDKARRHLAGILAGWPKTALTSVAKWPTQHTENHDLMQLTIGMFAERQRGQSVAGHVREIKKALAWRFERGWIEWNSPCYQFHYSNPLLLLADYAPAPELRAGARDLFNVLLAERAVLGVKGYLGGPAFRCRTADSRNSMTAHKVAYLEDGRYDGFLPTVWLAFGLGEPRFDFQTARVPGLLPATIDYATGNEPRLKQDEGMFFACSSLQPHPLVAALAAETSKRKSLLYQGQRYTGWPSAAQGEKLWATQRWMPGAIYYYNTPHVSMGSIHSSGWVCQSRYCRVLFAADPSQNLRVEMILPDVQPNKRRYEARGRLVQHKNWLLGQGTLFEDGGVQARRVGAWNVYKVGRGLCAHFALPDSYHVLQASDLDTFADEEAFVRTLPKPTFEAGRVHAAVDGDTVEVDTDTMAISINGRPRPHPPAKLHDCDVLTSDYGSGKITITTRAGSVTFDASSLRDAADDKSGADNQNQSSVKGKR